MGDADHIPHPQQMNWCLGNASLFPLFATADQMVYNFFGVKNLPNGAVCNGEKIYNKTINEQIHRLHKFVFNAQTNQV